MESTEREQLIKGIVEEIRNESQKQGALISEIVSQIRDQLKQDQKASWPKRISKFFQHPAFLLVLGFAITGLIGGLLANRWQRKEWDRQQEIQKNEWERQQLRTLDIHGIDLKYRIIDELTKAIGERNAAAKGILSPLEQELNHQQLIQEEKERLASWEKVSNDWRVNSQILKLKIATHIKAQDAAKIFEEISEVERDIAVGVVIVKNDLRKYHRDARDEEGRKHLDSILSSIVKTEQALKRLANVIAEEARNEIKKPS